MAARIRKPLSAAALLRHERAAHEAQLAREIAAHARYREIEQLLAALYDRPEDEIYGPAWSSEQFELQRELLSLEERINELEQNKP